MAPPPATVKCESEIRTSDPPAPSTNPDDSSKSDTQKSIRTNNPAAVAKKKVYSVKVENDTENTEVEPTDPAEALRLERLKKQKEKQQEFLKMQQKRKAEEELKVCNQFFHAMSSEEFLRLVVMTWETCWLRVERRCGKRSRKCRRCSISIYSCNCGFNRGDKCILLFFPFQVTNSSSSSPKRRKSIPSSNILPKISPR